ncbi:hypothetical protein M1446_01260 [Candidatus Dependentiae bacterium]|nr:hypothetical protein [Candidatus Dependentiae bacterium]
MKLHYFFLLFSLFVTNFSFAMESGPMPDGKQELTETRISENIPLADISSELRHFKKEIDRVKNDPTHFYSHLQRKLINEKEYSKYSDIIISMIYQYISGKKDKKWYTKLVHYLRLDEFFSIHFNEFKVCDELHDEKSTKLHIAVHLNAVDWIKKNLKSYYVKFDKNWSERNAEHYLPEIDSKDKNQNTPLLLAIKNKNLNLVDILLQYSNIMEVGCFKEYFTDLMNSNDKKAVITSIEAFFNTTPEIAKLIVDELERRKITELPTEMSDAIINALLDDAEANQSGEIIQIYDSATENLLSHKNYKFDSNHVPQNAIIDEDVIISSIHARLKNPKIAHENVDKKITKLHVAIYLKNMIWIKKNINNISVDDILAEDGKQNIPIIMAIQCKNVQLFVLLLHRLKAIVNMIDSEIFEKQLVLIFTYAVSLNAYAIIEYLINQKLITNVDVQDPDGETALIIAARKLKDSRGADEKTKKIIELLRKNGANCARKNNKGECAFELAHAYYPEYLPNDETVDINSLSVDARLDFLKRLFGFKK